MSWYRYGWMAALGAMVLGMLAVGGAKAASVWFVLDPDQVVCDVNGSRTCSVEIAWSVSNEDRFDKWKICWKLKESATWLDDHCDYNAKVRKLENNFYAIPGLEMGEYYWFKLEGRREGSGNWTCLHKGMIRSVGYAVRLGGGGICVDF